MADNTLALRTPTTFNFFDAEQFATMQRVCKMFASSELVPEMYQASEKNPENKAIANCMIAISIAMRVGADPLMIMQNMVPIYGKPSWSSKFLIATVNTCGRFQPLKFKFSEKGMLGKVDYTEYDKEWVDGTNGRKGYYKKTAKTITFDGSKVMDIECVAYSTALGSDEILESSPVTVRMAVVEGWYTKNGSKWPNMTKQMLMYRAASFWTSTYAPEISMGMKTEDEVRDIVDIDFEEVPQTFEEKKAANSNKETIGFSDEKPEVAPTTPEQPAAEAKPNETGQTPIKF